MAPYFPEGSIIVADTRERWPRDGELYLVQFNVDKAGKQKWAPQVVQVFYHLSLSKPGLMVSDNRPESKIDPVNPRIIYTEPEEFEARRIKWILGRVWGVLKRFK